MKRILIAAATIGIISAGALAVILSDSPAGSAGQVAAKTNQKVVTLYKNPQCTCCEGYAKYLRTNGFKVIVKPTHNLSLKSREAGIPEDFQGCHLAFIEDYVVSGHVPVKVVNRLLTERPAIKGITLPGMPMGSPGMTGRKTAPFEIHQITADGKVKPYATE